MQALNFSIIRLGLTGLAALLVAAAQQSACLAHGHPAIVNVVPSGLGGKLTVTAGQADPNGYASQIFAESDAELWLFPTGAGFHFTDAPGLNITGIEPGSELFYEIIPRPDLTAPGHPQRWLWQWDLSSQSVAGAGANATLSLNPSQSGLPTITFGQTLAPPNPLVKLADVRADQIGVHSHYLLYQLNDNDLGPPGVYGFFVRLVSPNYGPSDPFLIALNLNVPELETYELGAQEINVAAGLAGDFDVDADVDGGDFLLWQRTYGAAGANLPADGSLNKAVDAPDLAIWKSQWGRRVALPALASGVGVPEPASAALAAALALAVALRRGFRG